MKQRIERMEKLVRMVVATAIVKLLPNRRVTVQAIDVSPDLRQATLWVSAFDDEKTDLLEDIAKVHFELQQEVARKINTKFVPKLHFRYYSGSDHASRVDSLLNSL